MTSFNLEDRIFIGDFPFGQQINVTESDYEKLADTELLFESVELDEVESLLFSGMTQDNLMLEAVTTRRNKIERTMKAFNRKFSQALSGTGIASLEPEIGNVRKAAGFAILAAKIPTDDGQAISIIFHAPDNDPAKITPDDTLIAFRFMLNKRDVTHVVAPSGGHEISLPQVTLALSNLVERNSAKFKASTAAKAKLQSELDIINAEIEKIEEEHAQKAEALEKAQSELVEANKRKTSVDGLLKRQQEKNAKLAEQIKKLSKQKAPDVENFVSDNIKEKARNSTTMEFTAWASKTLGLSDKDAIELYDQAKGELKSLSDKLVNENKDEILEAVRNMMNSEFIDWAKDKLKLNAHDADVLFQQTREQLHKQYEDKLAEQASNKLAEQIHNALVEKYSAGLVSLYRDSRRPSVKVNAAIDSIDLSIYENDKDDAAFEVFVNSKENTFDVSNKIESIDGSATAQELDAILNEVDKAYKKYGSELVDLSTLPSYGSRKDKVSTSDLNKELRKAIKEAIANSKLPSGINATVKGNVGVTIRKLPDSIQLYSNEYLTALANDKPFPISGGRDSGYQGQYSADATALLKLIDATVNAYQETYGDPQDVSADYGTSKRFYFYGANFSDAIKADRKKAESATLESAPEEAEENTGNQSDAKAGENYDSEASISDIAKAVRLAISTSAKDASSMLHNVKATVKKGKSTHTDTLTVTIKQANGGNDIKAVIAAVEELLASYNKVSGSMHDDSTKSRFIPFVVNEVPDVDKTDTKAEYNELFKKIERDMEPLTQAMISELTEHNSKSFDRLGLSDEFKKQLNDISKYHTENPIDYDEHQVDNGFNKDQLHSIWQIKYAAQSLYLDTAVNDLVNGGFISREDARSVQSEARETIVRKLSLADMLGGAKFWYGLRARPADVNTIPNGAVTSLDSGDAKVYLPTVNESDIRHGAIAYSKQLSADDIAKFELVDLNKKERTGEALTAGSLAQFIVAKVMEKYGENEPTKGELDSLMMDFPDKLSKYARLHPAVENRKDDVDAYKEFKQVFDEELIPDDVRIAFDKVLTGMAANENDVTNTQDDTNQQDNSEPKSITDLRNAMTEEQDAEKLLAVLELAVDEVEKLDLMAEYEPMFDEASNRVTELLDQEAV